MPKVLMVTASKDFRDEEYLEPKKVLEQAGIEVKTASSKKGKITGAGGTKITANMTLDEIKPQDFDGIVFVGGRGATEYFTDAKALNLAKAFFDTEKIVAAICIAPVILANAELLQGKKATVFQSETATLQAKGANYTGGDVEVDGKIITASGPAAATKFGKAIQAAIV